jgi:thiol-disulfide isomerase/thioredoxin
MEKLHFDEDFDGILYLEDEDFDKEGKLIALPEDKGKPHLVMVFANWCGPCKATKPVYGELVRKNAIDQSKVRVACINASSTSEGPYKNRQGELSIMNRISEIIPGFMGFPTIVLFDKNGEVVKEEDPSPEKPAKMYKGRRELKDLVEFAYSASRK